MAAARDVEEQAAALDALRGQPLDLADPALRRALKDRNNFLVAKAARMVRELHLTSLIPALVEAFQRLMPDSGHDPVKTDPQCWAKNEIAKTLAAFEFQHHELFLAGMRHHQMEPVWGSRSDTAGALRGACALALVQCREVNSTRLLGWFTELFVDEDPTVRVEAARAIEQVGSDSAMLLLKLRAELAGDSADVLGACYGGVLRLEGASAIPWAAKFLAAADDAAAEAALAIAETRTAEAFELLKAAFATRAGASDPWFRSALLSAVALTRQPAAIEWLLEQIEQGGRNAVEAHEALCRSGPSNAVRERLAKLGMPCTSE